MCTRRPNCECKICLKPIYRRPYQISSGPVFCSTSCFNKRNFDLYLKICPSCGDKFTPNRKDQKTCSRTCSNKSRFGIKYKQGQPNSRATIVRKLKKLLLAERGYKCEECSFKVVEILQVHHVVRRCDGGSNELNNLKLLCPNCHALKHFSGSGAWSTMGLENPPPSDG